MRTLRRRAGRNDEAGISAVWAALMVTTLIAFAGLAVDLGNWYLHAGRQQNAADAGSLGGVVFMPGSITDATTAVHEIARQNGFEPSQVTVETTARPNQLRVTVHDEVPNTFLGVIGLDSQSISRTALAEFEGPTRMGSPLNIAGNDPESPGPQPDYWINLSGPAEDKQNGDRYGTKVCDNTPLAVNCDDGAALENYEFSEDGYLFTINSPGMTAQPLRLQIFDVAAYAIGSFCNAGTMPTSDELTSLRMLTDGPPYPPGLPADYYDDADPRYAKGNTTWCAGDSPDSAGEATVTVAVYKPSDPGDPQVLACPPQAFPAFDETLDAFDYLFPEGEPVPDPMGGPAGPPHVEVDPRTHGQHVVDPNDGIWTFAELWRRWATVCTIPANEVLAGEYTVQIRTNATVAAPTTYDPTVATAGHNEMSIRAGFASGDGVVANGVSFYAKGRLPIFANADAAATSFEIARALPGGPNRRLVIELFDMGDGSSPGTLQILPPVDSTFTVFPGCTFDLSGPSTPTVAPGDECKIVNVRSSSGYQGQLLTVEVPIDETYTCNVSSSDGCWVRVEAIFSGGVHDRTTWSASMNGDPVRLIE